jgi:putative membrane protein
VIAWTWQPSIVLGSLLLAGGYLYAVGPGRVRFAGAEPVSRWRVAAFLGGVAVLFLALASPLDALSDHYLLSAHMVQHMLLTYIMPPLLLIGAPGWLVRPLLRSWLVRPLLRAWTRPMPAFAVFNLLFGLAHFPVIYNFTLEHELAHIALHLLFMATAVVTWWPLLSPLPELPRLSYGQQLLYICLQTIPSGLIGALITLSGGVLYPTYAAAPRVTALSARADQQLAGLIMWVGGWAIFFVVLTIVFFVWASREQVRTLRTA